MYLSLIVPCYNEEQHLTKSFPKVVSVLKRLKKSFEIVIIDDFSKDNTVSIIEQFIRENPSLNIHFVKHKKNIGRGGTVSEGIRIARGEIVGFIDIDLEVSPHYIPKFLDEFKKSSTNVVVGKRAYPFSIRYIHRFISSKLYAALIRYILKLPVHDPEAGYKFFRRKKILPVIGKVKNKGWFFDTEIVALSNYTGMRVSEIDVLFKKNPKKISTVNLLKDSVIHLKSLFLFLVERHKSR